VYRLNMTISRDRPDAGSVRATRSEASTMSGVPAFGTPRVPFIIPVLNPLIRRLMGAGLPFGPNVLLTVRGRTSGQPRTFPVAILDRDGQRFVQSPFGEVNWVRNLRVAGQAVVTRGSSEETVEAVELTPEQASPILRDALEPYRRSRVLSAVLARFFTIPRDATLEDYVDEARRHPMFELIPTPDPA
jgi:deazaflavin-dependent oxidoreductase (nitroreductase family)